MAQQQQQQEVLHTLTDGSRVKVIPSKELIKIPIWNGNRLIDLDHVEQIKKAIGTNVSRLDFGYRIVSYQETDAMGRPVKASYIVDGQHRARVLLDFYNTHLCEPDFPVVVIEKDVETEFEVISYFNALNNSKPIKFTDLNIVINRYITELERAFNTKKQVLIRPKETRRPYLSAERVREALKAHSTSLDTTMEGILAFVGKVKQWNSEKVKSADMDMLSSKKDSDYIQSAAKLGFMLAVNPKLPWIPECL